jgi:hypothetical protein
MRRRARRCNPGAGLHDGRYSHDNHVLIPLHIRSEIALMNLRTLACLAVLGASTAATAQNTAALPYGPAITLEEARTCAAAVRAEAVKNDWLMVVTVVDSGGHVVLTERMDNAQFG